MTTSEQRAELVERLRDPLADLLTDGARDLRLRAADALEVSEADLQRERESKQRLIEAVRSEIDLARGYRPGSRELGRVPYISISSAEVLDTACTQAEEGP